MSAWRSMQGAAIAAATLLLTACGSDANVLSSSLATSTTVRTSIGPVSGATGSGADAVTTTRTVTTTTRVVNATGADGYGVTECPPAGGGAQVRSFPAPFKRCIDTTKTYVATITTNKGVLIVNLDAKAAPLTVNNFVALARNKFFDGLSCHRIMPAFVAQCGDPLGTGRGGPGYKIVDELPKAGTYKVGSLAMANSGPNTNGSQFFVITGASGVALAPSYSLFGLAVNSDATITALDAAGSSANNGVPPKQAVTITSVAITER